MNKESVLSAGQSIRKPSRGQQVSIDDFSSLLDVSRGWLKPDQVGELTAAIAEMFNDRNSNIDRSCLLYTSPSPRDRTRSRMPSSA